MGPRGVPWPSRGVPWPLYEEYALELSIIIYLNVFIVSASGGKKPLFVANLDLLASCTDPLLLKRAKFGVL